MDDLDINRTALMNGRRPTGWRQMALLAALVPPGMFLVFVGFNPIGMFFAAILGGPYALFAYFIFGMRFERSAAAKLAPAVAAEARTALANLVGAPLYIDTAATGTRDGKSLTGTGLAWNGKYLYVLDMGEVARIPLPAIRSWTWKIEGVSKMKVYGSRNSSVDLAVNLDNERAANDAHRQSGFFVTVADINKPIWQFTSHNEAVLRRWEEILTQINEGRLRAAE